jgi:hypothetical protein
VKILGFEVQRERIRKKQLQRLRNVMNRSFRKSRGSREWGFVQHIIYLVDRWLDAVCDRQPTAKNNVGQRISQLQIFICRRFFN